VGLNERLEPPVPDGWHDWEQAPSRSRARRAVGLIAVSLVVIAAAAGAYVHPAMFTAPGAGAAAAVAAHYRVTALDFVSPVRGWLTADTGGGVSTVMHTEDGGASWSKEAVLRTDGQVPYLKFFDDVAGVLALPGGDPMLARTVDAGHTWSVAALPPGVAAVLSWSFVDDENGWLLATDDRAGSAPHVWRTDDSARSWADLGSPVAGGDRAFSVQMSFLTTGWLASVGSRPYAYRSTDFGATWQRVVLPVAARPGAGRDGR
jgi:photosystem II stability/assembly factor-like uncharacterized protein